MLRFFKKFKKTGKFHIDWILVFAFQSFQMRDENNVFLKYEKYFLDKQSK